MNKRFLMALGGATFFGLMAIIVARAYLNNELDMRLKGQTNKVFFAKADIPAGTTIQESQIEEGDYPISRSQEVAKDKKTIVGKTASFDIAAKAPIFIRYLSTAGGDQLTNKVRQGYRAYSVPVNESSSVAGFVRPGSFVDIISVISGGSRPVARTILQNIRVLATGNQLQSITENPGAPRSQNFSTVTLEVPLEEAQLLALATREGSLQLVIRNPGDKDEASVAPTSMAGYIGPAVQDQRAAAALNPATARPSPTITPWNVNTGKPAPTPTVIPTPTPAPMHTVQIIQGSGAPQKYQFNESGAQSKPVSPR
jgi:pilus assembly protein CpaB